MTTGNIGKLKQAIGPEKVKTDETALQEPKRNYPILYNHLCHRASQIQLQGFHNLGTSKLLKNCSNQIFRYAADYDKSSMVINS